MAAQLSHSVHVRLGAREDELLAYHRPVVVRVSLEDVRHADLPVDGVLAACFDAHVDGRWIRRAGFRACALRMVVGAGCVAIIGAS